MDRKKSAKNGDSKVKLRENSELKRRIEELTGRVIYENPLIQRDMADYSKILSGMVLRVEEKDYFVRGDATEDRFGLGGEPKLWVKYLVDLESGERKILKLVFHEEFSSRIGPFLIRARRSPEKESDILQVVQGHPYFMQGRNIRDEAGNEARIIEFVRGPSLYRRLQELEMDHERYFFELFPEVLGRLVEAFEAMAFLLKAGRQHGDIRTDHLIIEEDSGRYVWIDFDYLVSHTDYDLWSLGEVLVFAAGKGSHTCHDVRRRPGYYPGVADEKDIREEDLLLVRRNEVANLRKLFPYIPEKLNRILCRFSTATSRFYDSVSFLLEDLREVLEELEGPKSSGRPALRLDAP